MGRAGNELCAEMLQRLRYVKWCPIVTVAGTNGKGTSCHLLADYWQRRGKKVGLFTSPHLLHFNERITINNECASDQELAVAFETIEGVQGNVELGYFHRAFLAAMLIFKSHKVDLMILEVGIGGRLDAVNSVDADYALITSIALDHTDILGGSREQIGFEKAGILRPCQIAVCGDDHPPERLLKHANNLRTQIYLRGRDFDLQDLAGYPEAHIPRQNALAVWKLLQAMDHNFNDTLFAQSLTTLIVPGRMQVIAEEPEILIDVAHNPHATAYLASYLRMRPLSGKTYAVFSALLDKDILGMCQPLLEIVEEWFLLELEHERGASKTMLHGAFPDANYTDYGAISELYGTLLKVVTKKDRIIVFGSFMLVGLFLEWHNQVIKAELG